MCRTGRFTGSLGALVLLTMGLSACGSSTPPAEAPPPPEPAEAPEPIESGPPTPVEPEPPPPAGTADSPPLPEEESVPDPRKVAYRVTPNGLIVEIEGARFTPKATAKKLPKGAYGIELEVVAEALDDRTHTLLSPKLGPLSMAAVIFDKKGEEHRRYNDRREGKEQQFLLPGASLTLERSWPSGEVEGPLWWGQKVRLEVGLWGLGLDGDEGRPVRKLFVVEMTAGNNPRAVVTPPDVPAK